jgi:hypothetical protein
MLVAQASETRRPFNAQQDRQGGVVVVVALGCEEEPPQLRAVQAPSVGRANLRAADVLGRVRGNPTVDVSEAVEAAHC